MWISNAESRPYLLCLVCPNHWFCFSFFSGLLWCKTSFPSSPGVAPICRKCSLRRSLSLTLSRPLSSSPTALTAVRFLLFLSFDWLIDSCLYSIEFHLIEEREDGILFFSFFSFLFSFFIFRFESEDASIAIVNNLPNFMWYDQKPGYLYLRQVRISFLFFLV